MTTNQIPKSASIVIVGGGVIGLSIARALALRGLKDILLIERAELGQEASFAAGGMLAPQVEADENDQFLKLGCSSRDLYPAFAASLLEETGVDVELDDTGTLYLAFNEAEQEEILHRFEWQTDAGLIVEKLSAAEARTLEPCIGSDACAALRFPHDIQVENRQLVKALVVACERLGVFLVTSTVVNALRIEGTKVSGVETSRGFVSTDRVVVAGGAWTSAIKGLPDITIEPVRGQMLCFRPPERFTRHVIYSPRGYLVPRRDGRLLAGSTAELVGYDKSVTDKGLDQIRQHVAEISPHVLTFPIAESWAGLRPRAQDNLPVLGPCGEIGGLVYATGHFRNGILLAPITAELIAAAIVDRTMSPLITAFTPERFHLVAT
jgi:glycine oxidase